MIRGTGLAALGAMHKYVLVFLCVARAGAVQTFRAARVGGRAGALARWRLCGALAKRALPGDDLAGFSGASDAAADAADVELTLRVPGAGKNRDATHYRGRLRRRRATRAYFGVPGRNGGGSAAPSRRAPPSPTFRARPQRERAARDAADVKISDDKGALIEARPWRARLARPTLDKPATQATREAVGRGFAASAAPRGRRTSRLIQRMYASILTRRLVRAGHTPAPSPRCSGRIRASEMRG